MLPTTLFIIGNGFDRAHEMPTGYEHFKKWLNENNRSDVIHELQRAYPVMAGSDYLLWCQFEKALGEYDLKTVMNWSWEDLYVTTDSLGNQLFNNGFIDTQLPDIISEAFTKWMRSIPVPSTWLDDVNVRDAVYLTFNYTDTLEHLYQIPEQKILHIHGRVSKGEKLIVGHNRHINPADYWDDNIDMRENNERMQRLTDMNTLCKPIYELIKRNEKFFEGLSNVVDIYIKGHSCDEIDYPYFVKVKESVPCSAKWHFNPYKVDDIHRIETPIYKIGIPNNIFDSCPTENS